MKKPGIILSLVVFCLQISAQEADFKGIFGFGFGVSTPVSDFADTDENSEDAGFAMPGVHVNGNFVFNLSESLGLVGMITANFNPVDVETMVNAFTDIDPTLNWEVESSSFTSKGFMGGFVINVPQDKVNLYVSGLVGFALATVPELTVTADDGWNFVELEQSEADGTDMAINLGAGIRYFYNEKVTFSLGLDYFSTSPEFEITISSNVMASETNAFEQKLQMVNLSAGIGFCF